MSIANQARTQVQLKKIHLCCGGCADAVASAVASVPGASCQCDMDNATVTITAKDDWTAQQALDAIADAGLYGETGNPHLAMKPEHDIPAGTVRKLIVTGIHNCCEPCYDAIRGAIETVAGVTGHTAQPGKTRFEVTGSFSAAELVRAVNAAGFHANVKRE